MTGIVYTPTAATHGASAAKWWTPPQREVRRLDVGAPAAHTVALEGVLDAARCSTLKRDVLTNAAILNAGMDGRESNDAEPHSQRAHIHDTAAAAAIWERISKNLGELRVRGTYTAVGLNARFRFIHYPPGGALVPHIDGSWYDTANGTVSLCSVIIYLDTPDGGATRLIGNPEPVTDVGTPTADGFSHDWGRLATRDETHSSFAAVAGNVTIIDHTLLHDSGPATTPKTVLRTDILYRRTR